MYDTHQYDYRTVNVILTAGSARNSEKIDIPSGNVVAMAAIVAGNTENRIIDLSILQNNQEIVRPSDVRFSEKTNGGTFKDSLRPINFDGGKTYEVKLVANAISNANTVTVQVLFMFEKTQY